MEAFQHFHTFAAALDPSKIGIITNPTKLKCPVPAAAVVRTSSRVKLAEPSAANVVRYPHSQNLGAVDTLVSGAPRNQCTKCVSCTGFDCTPTPKYQPRPGSDSATLSVRLRVNNAMPSASQHRLSAPSISTNPRLRALMAMARQVGAHTEALQRPGAVESLSLQYDCTRSSC